MDQNAVVLKIYCWLGALLPKRTKRLMCLASVFAYSRGSTDLDDETIKKLNNVMGLAGEDRAIKLPVHLSRAIWHGPDGKERISTDVLNPDVLKQPDPVNFRRIAEACVAVMPSWIRYGDDREMAEEVEKLFALDTRAFPVLSTDAA